MESLKTISKLEISSNKILYDKDSKRLAIEVFDFTFIGHYKKSTQLSEILDDLYKALGSVQLSRSDLSIIDPISSTPIPEITKLKDLHLGIEKMATEVTEVKKEGKSVSKGGLELQKADLKSPEKTLSRGEKEKKRISKPPPPGAAAPKKKQEEAFYAREEAEEIEDLARDRRRKDYDDEVSGATVPSSSPMLETEAKPSITPQLITYDINMGLQYYSVMMENQSYLFYVYFSHQELVIEDEEGKVVYKTKFTITTTKEEPPILDLRIEGEGFEVHPLRGKVEVKKKFINPPVMIFSVMPTKLKKKSKKKDKKGEKRYLHVYIDFDDKTVSHTILNISVQPKFYRLDLGPFHVNLSKNQAILVSIISLLITGVSAVYGLMTLEPNATLVDILSGVAPGIGSLIFVITFIATLITKGVFPIKEQVSALLNFDQGPTFIK
ncbi:MAG: hypothetical protein EU542_04840 [Promethearchaeota archaeon]|nr:MAG: hypothetical protein EU542_04840 [Candidatus Lokiarchaeota archaeon]